jgi:sugar lactone lactonase YvrE
MKHAVLGGLLLTMACGGRVGTSAPTPDGDGASSQCATSADPVKLATATHPIAIAIDGANAYWIDDTLGTVSEVPLCGGAAKTLVTTATLGSKTLVPDGLAVANGEVYFTTHDFWNPDPNGSVWKVSAAGGPATMLVDDLAFPGPIVVSGTSLLWIDSWQTTEGRIMQSALDGSAIAVLATAQNEPIALAAGGGAAVWSVLGEYQSVGGAIFQTKMGGGAVDGFVVGIDTPLAVTVQSGDVYWADEGNLNVENSGRVMKAPLDPNAGKATTLVSGGRPQGVAADGANVYWTDSATQSVQRIPIAGGTASTLAKGQVGPLAIAVDDANVYWVRIAEGKGEGAIMKTAK